MSKEIKKIAVFGSTGSIGVTTLDVIRDHSDLFMIEGLAAKGNNIELFAKQILEFNPAYVYLKDEKKLLQLEELVKSEYKQSMTFFSGQQGLLEFIDALKVSMVISAIVGFEGLISTYECIKKGFSVGLANKEVLVAAGEIILNLINKKNKEIEKIREIGEIGKRISLIPIDSEHSAIFQCLQGEKRQNIQKIVLTASGGPFRDYSLEKLHDVSVSEALKHPNWQMGKKITIDSATMFNKGLEIIEAHWLFSVPCEQIDVCIHPQSIVHSMVEFIDGSFKTQMGVPSMYTPILYSLTYPDRVRSSKLRLDLSKQLVLEFQQPKEPFLKAIQIVKDLLRVGGASCCLNAANEEAVKAFLDGKISFLDIYSVVEDTLALHVQAQYSNLDEMIALDCLSRKNAKNIINKRYIK